MKDTKIQWCDDTVNPVMGCDGCELWPTREQLIRRLKEILDRKLRRKNVHELVDALAANHSDIPHNDFIHLVLRRLVRNKKQWPLIKRDAKRIIKCYAGVLTEYRGGKLKGYPKRFESPMPFPGRVEQASKSKSLVGMQRDEKPWLDGYPRLIFISDMGDALSKSISFEYLQTEVINKVASEWGRQHVWLWLTKRPHRMAEFAEWLDAQGNGWPINLVAMTSITSSRVIGRVDQLCNVPAVARGLSLEPLHEPVSLDLTGIDWVIVGAESGINPNTFDVQWVRELRAQCRRAHVAFFVKQLGERAIDTEGYYLRSLHHRDSHGGDWDEWPEEFRIREIPLKFHSLVSANPLKPGYLSNFTDAELAGDHDLMSAREIGNGSHAQNVGLPYSSQVEGRKYPTHNG